MATIACFLFCLFLAILDLWAGFIKDQTPPGEEFPLKGALATSCLPPSLPQGCEGEVGGEPGPGGEGEENGNDEGEEERGEAEEDDPEGAEGVGLGEGDEEPGERDEADEQKADEKEEAEGEYGVSSIEYGEEEAGPRERGEVGAGVIDEERARGALPSAGRSSEQEDAVHGGETEEEERRGKDEREEDRPGPHEGFSGQRIGSNVLVN